MNAPFSEPPPVGVAILIPERLAKAFALALILNGVATAFLALALCLHIVGSLF